MSRKILIVDDEPDIVDLLKYNLEKEGYSCSTATNGNQALRVAEKFQPQLILLDIMMPELDGIETCRRLREKEEFRGTYIVFLTARAEEYSELAGFEAGADDYITKPIKPRVLISRIKAILKREKSTEEKGNELQVGNLKINRTSYTVWLKDKEMVLPKKEFELLFLLASKPGKVFTRESILNEVWGNDVYVVDRTIDVHIRKIREKIGDKKIKTIKGVGYKFEV
jgi:two-component system alkaline phosphatase synthesis response regulator PhoP